MDGRVEEEMSKRCRAEIKGEPLNRNGGTDRACIDAKRAREL